LQQTGGWNSVPTSSGINNRSFLQYPSHFPVGTAAFRVPHYGGKTHEKEAENEQQ